VEPFRDTTFGVAVSWYTNPQTEAFARLLQVANKVNPVPEGMAPPMVQGVTEAETSGETAASGSADALASEGRDGEMMLPKVGEKANGGTNVGEGGVGDVPSDPGMPSGMTYAEEPIASGGWSPSRIMSQ
jgi:hypothetical protein